MPDEGFEAERTEGAAGNVSFFVKGMRHSSPAAACSAAAGTDSACSRSFSLPVTVWATTHPAPIAVVL